MPAMIIGYLSPRGLGNMTHDLRRHLNIPYQMVPPDEGWPYQRDWADGNEIYLQQWEVQYLDLSVAQEALGIDTVISIETSYGDRTFEWAKKLGMRTILIPMWEAFNPHLPGYQNVDLYVCPSYKCWKEVPFDSKIFLPYPIDLEEFPFRLRSGPGLVFVHNAGTGGMNGRKGTVEAIHGFAQAALENTEILLIIHSQRPLVIPPWMAEHVRRRIFVRGAVQNRAELYAQGDVLIYTSHYDGHSLVGLEGMASGMPVITTDAEPMNEFWRADQRELLVRVERTEKPSGLVNPHCFAAIPDKSDIAEKILWCTRNSMETISARNRAIVESRYSWEKEAPRWAKTLRLTSQ